MKRLVRDFLNRRCPFCGCPAKELRLAKFGNKRRVQRWVVECPSCEARGPAALPSSGGQAAAVWDWNNIGTPQDWSKVLNGKRARRAKFIEANKALTSAYEGGVS